MSDQFAYEADFKRFLIYQIFPLCYTNSFLQNRYVADCDDFLGSFFSLIKHCTATLSISFWRARPIPCNSIPFFPLKCMCVEKSVHECTLVVIVSINVRKSYYFSREVTNPCDDFSGSLFSLNNKVTPIMMVDLPNTSTFISPSILLLGNMHQNSVHWQQSITLGRNRSPNPRFP